MFLKEKGSTFINCYFLQGGKGILLKSVGVVGANPDTVFEMVLSLDKHKRYE
jgi:hypothetical protein